MLDWFCVILLWLLLAIVVALRVWLPAPASLAPTEVKCLHAAPTAPADQPVASRAPYKRPCPQCALTHPVGSCQKAKP